MTILFFREDCERCKLRLFLPGLVLPNNNTSSHSDDDEKGNAIIININSNT